MYLNIKDFKNMHKRHLDDNSYIFEQAYTTEKHVIPYINEILKITEKIKVVEIGCGHGGNMKPFVDIGCKITGIDIRSTQIKRATQFFSKHTNALNVKLIESDIFDVEADEFKDVNLVILRDTLEHIDNQDRFLSHLFKIVPESAVIFIGFPPWYMPFAGHQQVCENRFLSSMPYYHLLPLPIYKFILKIFGEKEHIINELIFIKKTRITINTYKKIVQKNGFEFVKQDFFLINPNYEIKFGVKPRKLPLILNIPFFRDFFITTYYSIIKKR